MGSRPRSGGTCDSTATGWGSRTAATAGSSPDGSSPGQFKAAIPLAPIVNNVSYNYTTYYSMYEEMEWGMKPHQGDLMDRLWERSALKHVAHVRTPTLLVHGENDNDVPIGESEQFYVALKDVGVEAVMVRYPREGHGLAEPKHIVDLMERGAAWYERYFPR